MRSQVVKVIAGDEGVMSCRSLLDGIDDGGEAELQSRVTEGRCTVCMGSTFEDDLPEGDEVILCDGCNAEAHIRCLNMTSVPSSEWHCSVCAERMAAREARVTHSFRDIDSHRNREMEDALVIQSLDRKICQMSMCEEGDVSCAYCGLTEVALCSPLVVGQSRTEHDAYVMSCRPPAADGIIPGKKDTKVTFIVDGVAVETPTLEVPYFPYIYSPHGRQLLEDAAAAAQDGTGDDANSQAKSPAPIVHEMCALQMFQARMDRERYEIFVSIWIIFVHISLVALYMLPFSTFPDFILYSFFHFRTTVTHYAVAEHLSLSAL